jgi:predicted nucleotidyltransferase component of viral defense system
MNSVGIDSFQLREIFHLEFLRRLGGKLSPKSYAVKGGANLRFFFGSVRFSEDMDLDVVSPDVDRLKNLVGGILSSPSFTDQMRSYGLKEIKPPDMARAKQTETTQRFKVHLITPAGEDLFTKIEFSRRGFKGTTVVDIVADSILQSYRMTPIWVPHYDLSSAIVQKIEALAARPVTQARDIFDLQVLTSRIGPGPSTVKVSSRSLCRKALDRIFEVEYTVFRDTVLSYLSIDDRAPYARPESWDDIKLRVARYVEDVCEQEG